MGVLLHLETAGIRDAQGRFARLHGSYVRALRNIAQEESARLRDTLIHTAPVGETREFRKGFHYRTRLLGKGRIEAEVYYRGRKAFLIGIFERGAARHEIVARNVLALRFYWERGPEGSGIYFYRRVTHPGIKPTHFVSKAIEQWYPAAMANFYRRARQVTMEVTT